MARGIEKNSERSDRKNENSDGMIGRITDFMDRTMKEREMAKTKVNDSIGGGEAAGLMALLNDNPRCALTITRNGGRLAVSVEYPDENFEYTVRAKAKHVGKSVSISELDDLVRKCTE